MWAALYLCCLLAAGYPLAAALARRSNWIEITALTLCIGPGFIGLELIILSMEGIRPLLGGILAFAVPFAMLSALHLMFGPKRESLATGDRPAMWWQICCWAGIGYGVYAVGKDVFIDPVIEWDAFAIWQLKAQVLAILPLHPTPGYFSNLNLSYSHLRYPILVPMISAGMHAMTGSLDDYGKLVSIFWYVGMGLAVYATVRRLNGATAAMTATALLACAAPITHFGGSGTAEMALTAFFACSVLCILRWRETQQWGYIILASLLGAMMAWTKNDGVAMAGANVIIVAFAAKNWRKNLNAAAIMASIVIALYLPWIIYTHGLPRTDEDYAGKLNPHDMLLNAGRLWQVLAGFACELINWQDWGLFWIILAVLAIVERKRFQDRSLVLLAAVVVLHLAVYIPVLMVTSWKLEDLMAVTLGRLFMHAAPAGAILIGALWPHRLSSRTSPNSPV
jgi:hypothetical protein